MCKIGRFCVIEDGVEIEEMTEVPSYSLVTKKGIFPRRKQESNIITLTEKRRTAVA